MIAIIETDNLTRSLFRYWGEVFPTTWPTIYPGTQQDASDWPAWVELSLPVLEQLPRRRHQGLACSRFTLDVHCFARIGNGGATGRQLADAVQETLAGPGVLIRDFQLPELPVIGFARLREPDVRDLSRSERTTGERPLQHWLVSVAGRAQASEW